jgi:hypothetical protein
MAHLEKEERGMKRTADGSAVSCWAYAGLCWPVGKVLSSVVVAVCGTWSIALGAAPAPKYRQGLFGVGL